MARFSSSAVSLALWTKTSISQSESLKNGQFRRIFVISPPFFFQAEDGIRDVERSRGLGDVYKRQAQIRYRRKAQEKIKRVTWLDFRVRR